MSTSILPYDARRATILVSKFLTDPEPTGTSLNGMLIAPKHLPLHEIVLLKHIDDSLHVGIPIHQRKEDWFIHPATIYGMDRVVPIASWITLAEMKRLALDLPRGKIPFYKQDLSVPFY